MAHSPVCHDSFTCVPWLSHMCAMTHSHVYHDSVTCVPWLSHMCAMTQSHVCHDSFTCVPWLIDTCTMTHSHVPWLIHTCAMTHSHLCSIARNQEQIWIWMSSWRSHRNELAVLVTHTHKCAMTHSHVYCTHEYEWVICVHIEMSCRCSWLIHTCVPWLTHMCIVHMNDGFVVFT